MHRSDVQLLMFDKVDWLRSVYTSLNAEGLPPNAVAIHPPPPPPLPHPLPFLSQTSFVPSSRSGAWRSVHRVCGNAVVPFSRVAGGGHAVWTASGRLGYR